MPLKPSFTINSKLRLIEVELFSDMTLDEVKSFISEFKEGVTGLSGFSIISNAEKKSFESLEAAKELSVEFRSSLSASSIKKFAIVRPQGDYPSDMFLGEETEVKLFRSRDEAMTWISTD